MEGLLPTSISIIYFSLLVRENPRTSTSLLYHDSRMSGTDWGKISRQAVRKITDYYSAATPSPTDPPWNPRSGDAELYPIRTRDLRLLIVLVKYCGITRSRAAACMNDYYYKASGYVIL